MRGSKLYVGNLAYSVTKEQLIELFSQHGGIADIKVIEGKGFAFIEMSSQAEAEAAKSQLNGAEMLGRTIKVDEAKPPRSRGRGRGGRGGW